MKTKAILASILILVSTATSALALSQQEMAQLNDLLQKRSLEVLGQPTGEYDKHYDTGHQETPPPGCMNARIVFDAHGKPMKKWDAATGRWFLRWHCDGAPPAN